MRAISLWQPYATAIGVASKRFETRSWETKYRGPLAIHAAKKWTKDLREFAEEMQERGWLPHDIPLGAVVATVNLVDCVPTEMVRDIVPDKERAFGDFSPGRFAWKLEDALPVYHAPAFKGKQGFFSVPNSFLVYPSNQPTNKRD